MKKNSSTGRIIRSAIIAAVAAAGTAMFIAAARTKLLPASYLAALAAALTVLGLLIAFVIGGGKRFRLCAGVFLAAPYIFVTIMGCSLATRTEKTLRDAVVTVSPTMAPIQTAAPDVEPVPVPETVPEAIPETVPEAVPEEAVEPTPEAVPEQQFPDTFTIFVSGIDSREGLVDKSFSDVNILFTVNRATHQVAVVTTPRDAYVVLPTEGGVRDKLTHVGQLGIDAQVAAMEELYGVKIDYWFRLGFEGFENIVDALGGLTVNSDYAFTSIEFDFADQVYDFTEGENVLNGDKALVFARERMSFEDGDLQRGRDQIKLIYAMVDKILSPDLLANYSDVLDALDGCYETSVPYDLLAEMVRDQLANNPQWNVADYQVLGTDDFQVTYLYPELGERYVYWLDDANVAAASAMMTGVINGETAARP